ncbi:MAG TPA: histidine phosphatase family protein [Solirubrobacteraceae bacterium]|nr:histidine phosphatase family protein [Solirubrobacteraceae bacterium]
MSHEIVIVRHGATEWSESGQHTSGTDLPLIESGRQRAAELAPLLAKRTFALVLCSPLRRARETCELAGLGDHAVLCPDLVEWNYGEYEGLTSPQIWEKRPDWLLWRDGCPGGESPAQVAARTERVIARAREAGGNVALFAHGHVLRVLAARWIEMDVMAGARLTLGAGTISVLGFERSTQVIAAWNHAP